MENYTVFDTLGRMCKYRFWSYREDDHTQTEYRCKLREIPAAGIEGKCEIEWCPFYKGIAGEKNDSK